MISWQTSSVAQQISPQRILLPVRGIPTSVVVDTPTPTVILPTATLPPARVILPTATLPPVKSVPTGLYLQGKYIPVEDVTTSPEILDGASYNRWQVPMDAAGHHRNTPAFGEAGNVIIVGHSIWYGEVKVFAPVIGLEVGDMLTGVNADGTQYHYRVTSKQDVGYDDGSWLSYQTEGKYLLTLYTCNLHLTGLVVVQAEAIDVSN